MTILNLFENVNLIMQYYFKTRIIIVVLLIIKIVKLWKLLYNKEHSV